MQLFVVRFAEKLEKTTSRLLNAIGGNADLCKSTEAKKVPADYLEWVISNYNEKLIPISSVEKALNYVNLNADDLEDLSEERLEEDESFDEVATEEVLQDEKLYDKKFSYHRVKTELA